MNRGPCDLTLRETVLPTDVDAVARVAAATGFFTEEEVAIAVELVEENLAKGEERSGYRFVFLEDGDQVAGYACYGRIPGTCAAFDLYWIVVDPDRQRQGLGRRLMTAAEERIAALGGRQIFIETSSRPLYHPTHVFYDRCGYTLEHTFPDFYCAGDSKLVYVRRLG